LRHFRPRRLIEVGSGFSSAAMLETRDRFFPGQLEFTFIEPYPERLYSLLSDDDRRVCRILAQPVQDVDLSVFDALGENDILFVDSSHIGRVHSDLLHILFNVLPRLQKGVIVHFHDILWPFEYPRNWIESEGRAYNEAYFLRAFLQYNPAFEVLYFNDFMKVHHRDEVIKALPLAMKQPTQGVTEGSSSLWLRKVS
jgi:hypothetical protein